MAKSPQPDYRAEAALCRQRAARATGAKLATGWNALASEYDKLAEVVERAIRRWATKH
jgi:hypothetical protein